MKPSLYVRFHCKLQETFDFLRMYLMVGLQGILQNGAHHLQHDLHDFLIIINLKSSSTESNDGQNKVDLLETLIYVCRKAAFLWMVPFL
jgi:hypothetical protein